MQLIIYVLPEMVSADVSSKIRSTMMITDGVTTTCDVHQLSEMFGPWSGCYIGELAFLQCVYRTAFGEANFLRHATPVGDSILEKG